MNLDCIFRTREILKRDPLLLDMFDAHLAGVIIHSKEFRKFLHRLEGFHESCDPVINEIRIRRLLGESDSDIADVLDLSVSIVTSKK